MTTKELNSLSRNDIQLILIDQQDLYSAEEIKQLQEKLQYLKYQSNKFKQTQERPKEFNCPKCDAPNKSVNIICPYCGYKFKDSDYYNVIEKNNTKDTQTKQQFSNGVLYIISFLLPVVGIILGMIYISKNKEELGKSLIMFSIIMAIIFSVLWFFIIK